MRGLAVISAAVGAVHSLPARMEGTGVETAGARGCSSVLSSRCSFCSCFVFSLPQKLGPLSPLFSNEAQTAAVNGSFSPLESHKPQRGSVTSNKGLISPLVYTKV